MVDELQILRQFDSDPTGPSPSSKSKAEKLLATEIEGASAPRRPGRRLGLRSWKLFVPAAAAAAVFAVLALPLLENHESSILGGPIGTSKSANFFSAAAAAAERKRPMRGFQYQLINVGTYEIICGNGLTSDCYASGPERPAEIRKPTPNLGMQTWVSAKGSGRVREFDPTSSTGNKTIFDRIYGRKSNAALGGEPFWPLPKQPAQIKAAIQSSVDSENKIYPDDEKRTIEAESVLETIMSFVGDPFVTPAQRAQLYRLAARVPGVRIGKAKDYLGHRGVGISLNFASAPPSPLDGKVRRTWVLDRKSYNYLGSQTVLTQPAGDAAAGTVIRYDVVTKSGRTRSTKRTP